MTRNIVVAIIIILLVLFLLYPLARAQDGHAMYHATYYSGWINKGGAGCCNDEDCGRLADADERVSNGVLEVRILGEWCRIQPHHYLKQGNVPDASVSHVCVRKNTLYQSLHPCARLLCYQPRPGS